MKRLSILLVSALAAFAVLSPAAGDQGAKAPQSYALEVRLAPKESAPGQFTAEATVTDLATGKVIGTPRVEFPQGRSSTAMTSDDSGTRDLQLTAGVEGNATRATYTLRVMQGENVLASSKGSVKLR